MVRLLTRVYHASVNSIAADRASTQQEKQTYKEQVCGHTVRAGERCGFRGKLDMREEKLKNLRV